MLPVVACGKNTAPDAVRAIQAGCANYLPLPADRKEVLDVLQPLMPNHPVASVPHDSRTAGVSYAFVGQSEAFLNSVALAKKIAPTSIPVLITGESGTGKELLAYYLHSQSNRNENPYIRVNCAAISESLLESELFGHERGAFTGAHSMRKGRFERAHTGTLLLDEISETGPRLQAQLLRVLEQQDFERVGGNESIRVNVRIISTSNRDLLDEVEKGNFRRDLFHRLSGAHISIPALRNRKDDIEPLAWHFINTYTRESNRRVETIDENMLEALKNFHWDGNVRQLRNVIRNSLILGDGLVLRLGNAGVLAPELRAAPASRETRRFGENEELQLKGLERKAIFEALRRTGNKQVKAAAILGITDRTLRAKLHKYHSEDTALTAARSGEGQWQKALV